MGATEQSMKPHGYNHPVDVCDCGCNSPLLSLDEEPSLWQDEPRIRRCILPTRLMLQRALEKSSDIRARVSPDAPDSQSKLLLAALLDGYLVQSEILLRLVTFGLYGTGDDASDDKLFHRALREASDILRAGFNPDSQIWFVDADLGFVEDELNLGEDPEPFASGPVGEA